GDTVKAGYYVVLEKTISFFQTSKIKQTTQRVYTQNANGRLSVKSGVLAISPPKLPTEPLPTYDNTGYPKQVDIPAEFPGGINLARQFLANNIRYPVEAVENGVNGTVQVKFTVELDGAISNIEIVKKLGYGCDEEVIRVLKRMPKWTPAKLNGQNVKSYFTMPVSFRTQ
ncbi:MAG: energy transducer TonB, partial [Chitinophagaceae bacterium]